MSTALLTTLMHFTLEKTETERGLAVDTQLNTVAVQGLSEEDIKAQGFIGMDVLTEQMKSGEPIVTNNLITDPAQAPVTNTSYVDLRMILVLPVAGKGGIYVDLLVSQGIIHNDEVERLNKVIHRVLETGQDDASIEELNRLYDEING